ncbi:hypothetical protein JNN96_36140 [Mycobacterium sp. DSM 3803]|nr:hypothetical protein [Mycobacterium sp. DSM 3803]
MPTATLFAPKVRFANTFDSQFDAMMTWRAELELSYLVEDDTSDVLAGHADFLMIRVGEYPIDDLLDSLSEEAAQFTELFDGDDVAGTVQDQFDDAPFNRILIITDIEIATPLRGHALGAWLVSEIVDRMASPTDTLALLGLGTGQSCAPAAASSLMKYWRRVGLEPIEQHPQFLGQATAYSHLTRARAALSTVGHVEIVVPTSQICEEQPDAYPRHTIAAEDPQHLRLIRT